MRFSAFVICFCQIIPTNGKVASAGAAEVYQLSPDEIRMFLAKQPRRQLGPKPRDEVWVAGAKNDAYINGDAWCAIYTGTDKSSGFVYKYSFVRARCDRAGGDLRRFKVTCDLTLSRPPLSPPRSVGPGEFIGWCPMNTICVDWDYETMSRTKKEEIHCEPREQVNLDRLHISEAIPGSHAEMYCSSEQQVPHSKYALGSSKGLHLIVTEVALWPNGSAYNAPIMLIHDKTSPSKFDRAVSKNDHVVSTDILLRSIGRNQVQQKQLQFCVELVPGRREFWVILMYSWWRATGRRGHISDFIDNAEAQVDVLSL